ncbi:MAG: LysR substrate-binding domain-containing protein, partial [Solirubrobacteraceae bacterium]
MTELSLLKSFVAVAEELHFARAADRLHMAQSPLSQQIKRVEAQLEVRLFERTTRHVALTPAGELLLERAREILAAVEDVRREVLEAAAGELGALAIGFTGSATYSLMPAIATSLRRELPGAQLSLHGDLLTSMQVERLLAGELNLGVLRPPLHDDELVAEVIRREPLIAALPEGHALARLQAISVTALESEPFVCFPRLSAMWSAVQGLCAAHGFIPAEAHVAAETSTLIAFVAAGMGVSLVPASATQMRVIGAIYRPLVEVATVELALAWRRTVELP